MKVQKCRACGIISFFCEAKTGFCPDCCKLYLLGWLRKFEEWNVPKSKKRKGTNKDQISMNI